MYQYECVRFLTNCILICPLHICPQDVIFRWLTFFKCIPCSFQVHFSIDVNPFQHVPKRNIPPVPTSLSNSSLETSSSYLANAISHRGTMLQLCFGFICYATSSSMDCFHGNVARCSLTLLMHKRLAQILTQKWAMISNQTPINWTKR